MYGPISPVTKAIGSSAAMTVKVARMVGPPTSSTAPGISASSVLSGAAAASDGMFSTTTMASSTRMPIEKMRAKQRHPVEREAPGPGREQGRRQRQRDGDADDDRPAPAEREEDQQDDEGGGKEDQLADQLLRLLGCGLASCASPSIRRHPGSANLEVLWRGA